ncbi:hypothetical protein [Azospirillum soli]|uniref:hypothetical protein n=1 Tax=Azospirillum soli TaxID=1304799 RepID=UPI001AE79391|nr:hypothetical protein [Azospirillum soli]MBP2313031.1 hypothetical protein [Azospirillum soli]
MPAVTISQLPAGSALTGGEILPAVQDGATVRTTVDQLRAGLAAAAHGHALADVAGLQTALDGLRVLGRRSLWIPASALEAPASAGAEAGSVEGAAHGLLRRTLDFDPTVPESAQATLALPKSWDGGALALRLLWTAPAGTGDVAWIIKGAAIADGEPLDAAFGAAVTVTDSLSAPESLHTTDESAAITPDGTAADGGIVVLRITRAVEDAADTLDADAQLLGLRVFYDVDAASDD